MADVSTTKNRNGFVSPYTPRYREVFYSSIPIYPWIDLPANCITCLPCARDTFTAPGTPKPTTLNNKTAAAPPTPPPSTCTLSTLADIISCGDQNWLAGPQSGIPYSNIGDNVTDWTTLFGDPFTSDGSDIHRQAGDQSAATPTTIVTNGFTFTGKINMQWGGEEEQNNSFFWILADADKKRAVGIQWAVSTDNNVPGYQVLAWCDLLGDFNTNTQLSTNTTATLPNTLYDFSMTYADGILLFSVDGEDGVSVDLGCDLFTYLILGVNNQNAFDDLLNTLSIT